MLTRLGSEVVRTSAAPSPVKSGDGVVHIVDDQLRPAFAHQVGGHLSVLDVIHDGRQLMRPFAVAAVQLADLEPDRVGVCPHHLAGLVAPGANRDDRAHCAFNSRDGRHPLVVNAVLEVDHRPALGEVRHHQHRRPLCITRLDGDEYPVEGHP